MIMSQAITSDIPPFLSRAFVSAPRRTEGSPILRNNHMGLVADAGQLIASRHDETRAHPRFVAAHASRFSIVCYQARADRCGRLVRGSEHAWDTGPGRPGKQ